jgi:hypothetical protein
LSITPSPGAGTDLRRAGDGPSVWLVVAFVDLTGTVLRVAPAQVQSAVDVRVSLG